MKKREQLYPLKRKKLKYADYEELKNKVDELMFLIEKQNKFIIALTERNSEIELELRKIQFVLKAKFKKGEISGIN